MEQDFAYTTTWGNAHWTQKTTTITTTDLIRPDRPVSITVYKYIPITGDAPFPWTGGIPNQIPVEDTITYEDGSGNVLHTVKKVWNSVDLLAAECDILQGNAISGKFYQYAQIPAAGLSTDAATDVSEYDYGQVSSTACVQPPPGVIPAREVKTTYAAIQNSPLWPTNATYPLSGFGGTSTVQVPYIPQSNDRPEVVQIFDHGVEIAETDANYDEK